MKLLHHPDPDPAGGELPPTVQQLRAELAEARKEAAKGNAAALQEIDRLRAELAALKAPAPPPPPAAPPPTPWYERWW